MRPAGGLHTASAGLPIDPVDDLPRISVGRGAGSHRRPVFSIASALLGALSLSGCAEQDETSLDETLRREIVVLGMESRIVPGMADEIVNRIANVQRVATTYARSMDVRHGDETTTAVVFVDGQLLPRAEMSGRVVWPLESGTYMTSHDAERRSRVAIIGGPVRDHLFGRHGPALDEEILIDGEPFRVKGVLGPHPPFKDVSTADPVQLANTVSNRIYLPHPLGVDLLFGADAAPFSLRVSVIDTTRINETASFVEAFLANQHGDGFAVETDTTPPPHGNPPA